MIDQLASPFGYLPLGRSRLALHVHLPWLPQSRWHAHKVLLYPFLGFSSCSVWNTVWSRCMPWSFSVPAFTSIFWLWHLDTSIRFCSFSSRFLDVSGLDWSRWANAWSRGAISFSYFDAYSTSTDPEQCFQCVHLVLALCWTWNANVSVLDWMVCSAELSTSSGRSFGNKEKVINEQLILSVSCSPVHGTTLCRVRSSVATWMNHWRYATQLPVQISEMISDKSFFHSMASEQQNAW